MRFDMNRLSIPINKTAALVVNQSGCEKETEYMRLVIKMEELKKIINKTREDIVDEKNKKTKKELGKKYLALCQSITPLKQRLKELNISRRSAINELIIKECMQRFTDEEWKSIMRLANEKFQAGQI